MKNPMMIVLASSKRSPMLLAVFRSASRMNGLRKKISARMNRIIKIPYVATLNRNREMMSTMRSGKVTGANRMASGW